MNRLAAILAVVLAAAGAAYGYTPALLSGTEAASGGAAIVWADAASSDNTGAYVDDQGGWEFNSSTGGTYEDPSSTLTVGRRTGDAHGSIDQWGVMCDRQWNGTGSNNRGFTFRNTDLGPGDQDNYHVTLKDDGDVLWSFREAGSTSFNGIQTDGNAGTPSAEDCFAACIEGTGDSTIVKGWLETSEPAACNNTCANDCGWGTPDISYTNNPNVFCVGSTDPAACCTGSGAGTCNVDAGLITGIVQSDFAAGAPLLKLITLGDTN